MSHKGAVSLDSNRLVVTGGVQNPKNLADVPEPRRICKNLLYHHLSNHSTSI